MERKEGNSRVEGTDRCNIKIEGKKKELLRQMERKEGNSRVEGTEKCNIKIE